jgi:dihydrofolate reductase
LPWHISGDLKLFKEITYGSIVVMGRKTFDSIGKALPGRKNFIISASISNNGYTGENLPNCANTVKLYDISKAVTYKDGEPYYFKSLEAAFSAAASLKNTVKRSFDNKINKDNRYNNIFIIGGASVYRQALPFINKMYISFVKKNYKGNIYFPEFNIAEWNITEKQEYPDFIFTVFEKKQL